MVLGAAEGQGGGPVAQGEHGGFLAGHELLDHQPRAGLAEAAVQHVAGGVQRLGAGGGDHHALAGGQAIGLEHVGRGEAVQRLIHRVQALDHDEAGGRQMVAFGEGLGEGLGGFQLGRLGGGTEAGDAQRLQPVGQALFQRRLGPDHHEVGLNLVHQGEQAVHVVGGYRAHLAQLGHAGVAGGDHQAAEAGGLGDLPRQGVFAATAAHQQDVHALCRHGVGV